MNKNFGGYMKNALDLFMEQPKLSQKSQDLLKDFDILNVVDDGETTKCLVLCYRRKLVRSAGEG